ncbi:DUF3368 domain-containing protein [Deltaproteobacteria bacterium TL4]
MKNALTAFSGGHFLHRKKFKYDIYFLTIYSVYYEVVVLGEGRPGANEVKEAAWIKSVEIKDQLALKTLRLTLGIGESESIILASERKADYLILDDKKARQIAIELGLPVVGTVAVLSKATQKGLLQNLQKVLLELQKAGFRFLL